MITFYPGPSRINSKLPDYFKDAVLDGVMSLNHRSAEFEKIYADCVQALKEKLSIPEDYEILFTSSATECWEIIAQSLIKANSYHIYNGAFGEKWFSYTKKIRPAAQGFPFDRQKALDVYELDIPEETELIAVTQNETSNGTALNNSTIKNLRERYPDQLIAVDATSSMAGIQLDFADADIWFASVQKCFGLPAGLGIMICSPQALKIATGIDEKAHYNSFNILVENMRRSQTSYTPNVLNIYFLMRVMQDAKSIVEVEQKLKDRYKDWLNFFARFKSVNLLIKDDRVRSRTVLTLSGPDDLVKSIKQKAKKAGILIGNGYGDLKDDTFRLANFPAIKSKEIRLLEELLQNNLK